MFDPIYRDKFRRPERFLAEIIRRGSKGSLDAHETFLHRAIVLAVDVLGGKLESPDPTGVKVTHVIDGKSVDIPAKAGPANPRNSVKARIISQGLDKFVNDDNVRVFWPLFPEHMSVPVKPGEFVYVLFEDEDRLHGLWVSKVSGHENTNLFKGEDSFHDEDDGSLKSKYPDSQAVASQGTTEKFNTVNSAAETKQDDRLSSKFQ